MIPEMLRHCKEAIRAQQKALQTVGMIILSTSLFLGLARLSWLYSTREPVQIEEIALGQGSPPTLSGSPENGQYVASKAGKKYYLTSCSGAKSIKESNKIFFATKAAAEARGYTPAATCKGM